MKRGGQIIYSGPLGPLSGNMIQYFEAIPRCPTIKNGQNPAAWMLEITSPSMEYSICVDYAGIFRGSLLYGENMKRIEELSKAQDDDDLHFPSRYEQTLEIQCAACLWKQHKSYWKNPEHNVVRFINTFTVSLLFDIVFWQLGSKTTSELDIFNILGVVYASALFLAFATASILQPVVALERTVFYREKTAGMYSYLPYAIAQVAVEIPYVLLQVLIFSIIGYPMIGFQFTVVKFCCFTLFILLSFIYFMLYGMMTVALTPNQEIAAGLSFLIFILWSIFCGFIIPRKMIPVWWRWFYWASPTAWTIHGVMFSQLGDWRVDYCSREAGSDGCRGALFRADSCPSLLFLFLFGFSIKHLNFQER